LQRARETLSKRFPEGRPPEAPRPSPAQQKLLSRYLQAWEGHDVDGFVALLKEDATITMPPWLQWYVGREAVRTLFAALWRTCGGLRVVPNSGQRPACFRRLSTVGRRQAVVSALHPRACAAGRHNFHVNSVHAACRPTAVPRLWTSAQHPGRRRAASRLNSLALHRGATNQFGLTTASGIMPLHHCVSLPTSRSYLRMKSS
jgi:hypothetical protein